MLVGTSTRVSKLERSKGDECRVYIPEYYKPNGDRCQVASLPEDIGWAVCGDDYRIERRPNESIEAFQFRVVLSAREELAPCFVLSHYVKYL